MTWNTQISDDYNVTQTERKRWQRQVQAARKEIFKERKGDDWWKNPDDIPKPEEEKKEHFERKIREILDTHFDLGVML